GPLITSGFCRLACQSAKENHKVNRKNRRWLLYSGQQGRFSRCCPQGRLQIYMFTFSVGPEL
ncbi:MAG: hypothetical protein J6E41_07105, partial [Lachnospiraceae bacterium]|nr:hypothetical protein [Lachnospiraceae bacterium]